MSKKCTTLWRKAHFEVKMYKTRQLRSTFCWSDVEKLHAAVAKSTFGSENVQSMMCSEHFWKFRHAKMARRCGEKYISKPKCTKHYVFGTLFAVLMSKICTPLWRNAHLEAKMYKTWCVWSTFCCSVVINQFVSQSISQVVKKFSIVNWSVSQLASWSISHVSQLIC